MDPPNKRRRLAPKVPDPPPPPAAAAPAAAAAAVPTPATTPQQAQYSLEQVSVVNKKNHLCRQLLELTGPRSRRVNTTQCKIPHQHRHRHQHPPPPRPPPLNDMASSPLPGICKMLPCSYTVKCKRRPRTQVPLSCSCVGKMIPR